MSFARILFFALLLFYSALILSFTSMVNAFQPVKNLSLNTTANAVDNQQQQLVSDYQQKLNTILDNYSPTDTIKNEKQKMQLLENDLLAMKVPSIYRNLHLDLIKALYAYQQGQKDSLAQSRLLLQESVKKYAWLSSNLSLFIINNFQ